VTAPRSLTSGRERRSRISFPRPPQEANEPPRPWCFWARPFPLFLQQANQVNRRAFCPPGARAESRRVDHRLSRPWRVNTGMRLQEITFGELLKISLRGVLVYCHCGHNVITSHLAPIAGRTTFACLISSRASCAGCGSCVLKSDWILRRKAASICNLERSLEERTRGGKLGGMLARSTRSRWSGPEPSFQAH
jgi:hypothetical protein